MTASGTRLLDLVCGPAGPLPETHQRYRLVAHLGSGGQADVYRAVRLCGGVTSAPLTVKVFRVDPRRPLVDELRSWDKGDAALMDLNNRGVGAICRRADGFYGPPPHRPGEQPAADAAVPYQVYDYLHGINLREYVVDRSGLAAEARRLNAVLALSTLATVLRALHHPQETGATPVLHMDVKPSNVMVLATGEVKLIDFTGARYWRPEEITQIAYTPESGGPEAFGGVSQVSPAYDVHGFGAVAYFLVTGDYPREPGTARHVAAGEESPPPWSVLRRHPMLERLPALRDHLHQPLADRPADRPVTRDLPAWVEQLADLVRRSGVPDVGVDWGEPETSRAVGRAKARPPVAGTETEAFQRIEKLERELVELRAAVGGSEDPRVPATAAEAAHLAGHGAHVGGPVSAAAPGSAGLAGVASGAGSTAAGAVGGYSLPTGSAAGFGSASGMGAASGGSGFGSGPGGSGFGSASGMGAAPGGSGPGGSGFGSASGLGAAPGGSGPGGSGSGFGSGSGSSGSGGSGSGGSGMSSAGSGEGGSGGRGSGPAATRLASGTGPGATRVAPEARSSSDSPVSGAPGSPAVPPQIRGRAAVPPPKRVDPTDSVMRPGEEQPDWRERPKETPGTWKRGWELSGIGAFFAFICWGIWAASARGRLATPLLAFVLVLAVAAGVFLVTRLVGRLVLVQRLGRTRRTAKGAHALTGLFLVAAGVAYLQQTPWVVSVYNWLVGTN